MKDKLWNVTNTKSNYFSKLLSYFPEISCDLRPSDQLIIKIEQDMYDLVWLGWCLWRVQFMWNVKPVKPVIGFYLFISQTLKKFSRNPDTLHHRAKLESTASAALLASLCLINGVANCRLECAFVLDMVINDIYMLCDHVNNWLFKLWSGITFFNCCS